MQHAKYMAFIPKGISLFEDISYLYILCYLNLEIIKILEFTFFLKKSLQVTVMAWMSFFTHLQCHALCQYPTEFIEKSAQLPLQQNRWLHLE